MIIHRLIQSLGFTTFSLFLLMQNPDCIMIPRLFNSTSVSKFVFSLVLKNQTLSDRPGVETHQLRTGTRTVWSLHSLCVQRLGPPNGVPMGPRCPNWVPDTALTGSCHGTGLHRGDRGGKDHPNEQKDFEPTGNFPLQIGSITFKPDLIIGKSRDIHQTGILYCTLYIPSTDRSLYPGEWMC